MFKPVQLLACVSLFAMTACAAEPGVMPSQISRAPQCFHANEVFGYAAEPDGSVQLQTAQGPFQIRLGPNCPDFSWMMQIGVRPVDDSWLCEGHPQQIITAYQSQFSRCRITDIESLAGRAVAA
jgi:hypothetical protein